MCGFLIIVLLCIGAFYFSKNNGCQLYKSKAMPKDALDTLRERYARGEIGSDEFLEHKRILEEGSVKQ